MSEHLTATRAGERFGVAIAAATDCHQACVEGMSYGLQRRGSRPTCCTPGSCSTAPRCATRPAT